MNETSKKRKVNPNDNSNEVDRNKNSMNISNKLPKLNGTAIPEHLMICEVQESLFCGRHALRALVQRLDVFDDTYLMSLGEQLSSEELIVREDETTLPNIYFNVSIGYYQIQVLERALQQQFNVQLVKIDDVREKSDSILHIVIQHIFDIQALLIHKEDHYFCLRRFDNNVDCFFIID
jgi:hypothetical protein